jgi:dolichyl-phosphate beta-glucosyltransferase
MSDHPYGAASPGLAMEAGIVARSSTAERTTGNMRNSPIGREGPLAGLGLGQAEGCPHLTTDRLLLSIVVPAFNEAARLTDEAERIHEAVIAGAIDASSTELIVVDDGSSDGTAQRSKVEFGRSFPELRVLQRKANAGKGAAIRDGVAVARAPIVLFMDADMAVDPRQTPLLVSAMQHADVAIGSRSVPGSSVQSDNFRRAIMGRTFSRYVNMLTDMGIRDTQCGFKAFLTPVARLLFHCMVIDRFAFDVELLYLARRLHFRVTEVPIHWRDVDGSAVRPVVDPFSMVFDVLRMRAGRKSPRIPALTISCGDSDMRSLLFGMFGQTHPIVQLVPGRTDVLFPLSNAEDLRRAVPRLREIIGGAQVRERAVSVGELMDSESSVLLTGSGSGAPALGQDAPRQVTAGGEDFVRLSAHDSPLHADQESFELPGA